MLTGMKDVDYKILNELNDKDLVSFCSTNKKADEYCNDQTYWMVRTLYKFPKIPLEVLTKHKGERTWSEYYINDLRRYKQLSDKILSPDFYNEIVKNGRLDILMILDLKHLYKEYIEYLIFSALSNKYLDIAEYLIKNTDVNWILRIASREGDLNVIKFALEHGADIHVMNDHPVRVAYRRRHMDIVDYLVSQGAKDPR